MKRLFWLAAIGAACVSNSAFALTIVQTDSEARLGGFDAFDTSKGTLNSVTLDVRVSSKSRVWQVNVPAAQQGSTATIGWTVNGKGNWELGSNIAALNGLTINLTGSGGDTVTFDRLTGNRSRAFAYFDVAAGGSRSFNLDTSLFTGGRISFNGYDRGYFSNIGDTTFSNLPMNANVFQVANACVVSGGNPTGGNDEDACGGVNYTLTYNYTAAVPEPGTWALMLAGFATTGVALRRRRRTVAA